MCAPRCRAFHRSLRPNSTSSTLRAQRDPQLNAPPWPLNSSPDFIWHDSDLSPEMIGTKPTTRRRTNNNNEWQANHSGKFHSEWQVGAAIHVEAFSGKRLLHPRPKINCNGTEPLNHPLLTATTQQIGLFHPANHGLNRFILETSLLLLERQLSGQVLTASRANSTCLP